MFCCSASSASFSRCLAIGQSRLPKAFERPVCLRSQSAYEGHSYPFQDLASVWADHIRVICDKQQATYMANPTSSGSLQRYIWPARHPKASHQHNTTRSVPTILSDARLSSLAKYRLHKPKSKHFHIMRGRYDAWSPEQHDRAVDRLLGFVAKLSKDYPASTRSTLGEEAGDRRRRALRHAWAGVRDIDRRKISPMHQSRLRQIKGLLEEI